MANRKDDDFLLGKESPVAGRKADSSGGGPKFRGPKLGSARGAKTGASSKRGVSKGAGGQGRSGPADRLALAKGAKQAIFKKLKVNSRNHDHAVAHAIYISRKGMLTVENDRGEKLESIEEIVQEIHLWNLPKEASEGKRKRRDDYRFVLASLPPGFEREKAMEMGRQWGQENFAEHPHLITVHHEAKNTHIHLQVKTLDWDGKSALHLSRDRTRELRESYARIARAQGVALSCASRAENAKGHPSIEADKGQQARQRGFLSERDKSEIRAAAKRLLAGDFVLREAEAIAYARRGNALQAYHDDIKLMRNIALETGEARFQQGEKDLKAWANGLASAPVVPSREIKWMVKLVEARGRLIVGERHPEDVAMNRITEKMLGDARHFAEPTDAQLKALRKLDAPKSALQSRRKAGEYIRLRRIGKADEYEDERYGKEHQNVLAALGLVSAEKGGQDPLQLHRNFTGNLAKHFEKQALRFMRKSIERAPDITD